MTAAKLDPARAVKTLIALVNAKLEFQDDPEEISPLNEAKRWLRDIAADLVECKPLTRDDVPDDDPVRGIAIRAIDELSTIGVVARNRIADRIALEVGPRLTEEQVREVVRMVADEAGTAYANGTIASLPEQREYVAARAAKELAGAVAGLSERDQEILSVLIDDVQAFGAGDEDDRKDERFQRDTLSLLRRLKRDAAFDRAALAITGQPAAELTAQLNPATASIEPADIAVIDEALGYWSTGDSNAPHEDIRRIRALLASPGGGS